MPTTFPDILNSGPPLVGGMFLNTLPWHQPYGNELTAYDHSTHIPSTLIT